MSFDNENLCCVITCIDFVIVKFEREDEMYEDDGYEANGTHE